MLVQHRRMRETLNDSTTEELSAKIDSETGSGNVCHGCLPSKNPAVTTESPILSSSSGSSIPGPPLFSRPIKKVRDPTSESFDPFSYSPVCSELEEIDGFNEIANSVVLVRGDYVSSCVSDGAKQNDVIIMGRYLEDDYSGVVIAYVWFDESDLRLKMDNEKFFSLKVLKDCVPKSNLFIKAKGVRLSLHATNNSSENNLQTVELNKLGTSLFIEHASSEPVVLNGTFDFCELNGKETIYHGSIEVQSLLFPFEVTRISSSGNGTEQRDVLLAAVRTKKELIDFFALDNVEQVEFCTLVINMERIFVKTERIASLVASKVKIENLLITRGSESSNIQEIGLLLKLPFCRKVKLTEDHHRYKNVHLSDLERKSKTVDELQFHKWKQKEKVEERLLDFFVSHPNLSYLKSLELVGVNLQPKGLEKAHYLGKLLYSFVQTEEKVFFTLEDSRCSFYLLILLTSNNRELTEILVRVDPSSLLSVSHFSLAFRGGRLNYLHIHNESTIRFKLYEEVTAICHMWRLPQTDNIKCDNLALIHEGRDYSFLFQLINSFAFDHLKLLNKIQTFKFQRHSLKYATEILPKFQMADDLAKFSMKCINVEISEYDSRYEMDGLIAGFCEELNRLGVRIKTLKLDVHNDESGWAFIRFTLTKKKTIVQLNDLKIIFPSNCTKKPQLVAIEINSLPKYIIDYFNQQRTNGNSEPTPLVSIDNCGEKPFLQQISVVFPFPKGRESFSAKLFSKHPPEKMQWEAVSNYEIALEDGEQKLIYQSDTFSPVVGEFYTGEASSSPENYVQKYFKETTFVTILALEYRIGNVVFDCVKEKDETDGKNLRLNPFFEKRKVCKMEIDEQLRAQLGKNLTVLEPELEKDNELEFFCPDHENHVSNQQEYTMRKVDANGAWRGYIHYHLVRDGYEKKLFHMFYHLPHVTSDIGQDDSNKNDHTQQPNHGESH